METFALDSSIKMPGRTSRVTSSSHTRLGQDSLESPSLGKIDYRALQIREEGKRALGLVCVELPQARARARAWRTM